MDLYYLNHGGRIHVYPLFHYITSFKEKKIELEINRDFTVTPFYLHFRSELIMEHIMQGICIYI